VEVEAAAALGPGEDGRVLVDAEIVEDEVELAPGMLAVEMLEEGEELLLRGALETARFDGAGGEAPGGQETGGAEAGRYLGAALDYSELFT
jgi:hypothetical protein